MFESFLLLVEEVQQKKHYIDKIVMTFKDAIIATDISSIIRIGTVIAGFGIMITCELSGKCIMNKPYDIMFDNKNNFSKIGGYVKINIVGRRQNIYSVLQSSVLAQNLRTYFTEWENISNAALMIVKDCQHNPVLKESVDTNWMLGYYVHNELKQIKSLLDTDLQEAKKRISVMEYMINSKVKN